MIDQSSGTYIFFFRVGTESLGKNDNALPIDIVGSKEFTQDNLGFTIRIYIGRIECLLVSYPVHPRVKTYIDTLIISVFELPDPFFMVGNHPILS
jgi:hypothetical protein